MTDIAKMDIDALRARYRQLREWYIATLRGNNYTIDEDALLHRLSEEYDEDSGRDQTSPIDIGGPCPLMQEILDLEDTLTGYPEMLPGTVRELVKRTKDAG